MTSRKFAIDGERENYFPKRNSLKNSSKKNFAHSSDGFFINRSKNKKNNVSDIEAIQKNNPTTSQTGLSRNKGKHLMDDKHTNEPKTAPKIFDKKAWRFKRYSKKYRLEQWKDLRKASIVRKFEKTGNENATKLNVDDKSVDHIEDATQKQVGTDKDPGLLIDDGTTGNRAAKFTNFKRNKVFNKRNEVDEETNNEKSEYLKLKAEKEEAIKEYKRKKLEKYKKLNRKTKKGQPVMKGRIEVLLEEIQKNLGR